jgi:hypothetical protein
MSIGTRTLIALLPLSIAACPDPSAVDPSEPAMEIRSVQLESLYSNDPVRLGTDVLPARSLSLHLVGRTDTALKGTLVLDPNTCSLGPFGDRRACTRIAVRAIDVEVERVRTLDPGRLRRRLFDVSGEGLPEGLSMIVQGQLEAGALERCYLKLGAELVPLYLDDGV